MRMFAFEKTLVASLVGLGIISFLVLPSPKEEQQMYEEFCSRNECSFVSLSSKKKNVVESQKDEGGPSASTLRKTTRQS